MITDLASEMALRALVAAEYVSEQLASQDA